MKKKPRLKLYNIKIILSVVFIFLIIVNFLLLNTGNFQKSIDNKNNNIRPIPNPQPILPKKLGFYYNDSGMSYDVFISGDIAYIADGDDGLEIVNISDPSEPELLGAYGSEYVSSGIFVTGDLAYLADWDVLKIINISDPTKPVEIGFFNVPAKAVYVSGGIAYVAGAGLSIINVSDPTSPVEMEQYLDGSDQTEDVFLSGTIAYVADRNQGLEIIDIRDPYHSKKIGYYNDGNHNSYGICISENIAFLADGSSGLKIIDVSDPFNPINLANYSGVILDICISGNIAYIADYNEDLKILDISNPSNPTELGAFNDGGYFSFGLFYSRNKVYIAESIDGMEIIDVSLIEGRWNSPSYLGSLTGINFGRGLDIWNNTAYVCDRYEGLRIIDITDPTSPEEIANYHSSHQMFNVFVSNNIAYATVAITYDRLTIINVTDPLNTTGSFREIGFYEEPSVFFKDVEISGNFAYITEQSGLIIINITDPTYPRKVVHFPLGSPQGIDICGNYAYIGAEDQGYGLRIIDISDPSNPIEVGHYDGGGNPRGVFVSNDIAYVADGLEGLEIIDVSDPYNPDEIGSFKFGTGVAVNVHIFGNLAFLADTYDGLEVINITDPTNPSGILSIPGDFTWNVYADSRHIYFVDDTDGFCIYNNGYLNPSTTNSDSDILTDAEELFVYGTDPDDSDTDNDGLDDGEEINTYTTDPNNPDSDYDNMPDGWEVYYNFNPNNRFNNVTDYDSDGLLNIYEYTNNTDPRDADSDDDDLSDYEEISVYTTNPNNPDSDYDDLPDGWEVSYSLDPKVPNKNEDSDVDGLTNYEEYLYGTDPRLADTDGDGYNDGEEINAGTNPLNPNSYPFTLLTFFEKFGSMIGIITAAVIISIALIVVLRRRSKGLRIFVSHAMEDNPKYGIEKIAEYLKSKKGISKVFICEEDVWGNIKEWMDTYVPRSQLLIIFFTENFKDSKACKRELKLALKHGLVIMPILGEGMDWENLKEKSKELEVDITDEFGTTFDFKDPEKFKQELYDYAMRVKKKIKEDIEEEKKRK